MITIHVDYRNERIQSFEISGHANSGPYGYDLVCAAVSAVSFGAINAVLELCHIDLKIKQGTDGGYLHVMFPDAKRLKEEFEKAQLIFEAMIVSLQTIEREHKQFIRIQKS